ncbi:hypothetical protein OH76DRAFT_1403439 [Lentinus brumalis]|uniref:Uncharacterized protein n=1 Tax=Lentinus brumalis TaxID=2498619 RepID=A0A371DBD4_9APHY|nr:hypothetical protein OH76DRAFT_1403439 [Polyporus brumalis]
MGQQMQFKYVRENRMGQDLDDWGPAFVEAAMKARFSLVPQSEADRGGRNPMLYMSKVGDWTQMAEQLVCVPKELAEAVRVVTNIFHQYQTFLLTCPFGDVEKAARNKARKVIVRKVYSGLQGIICAAFAVLLEVWERLAARGLDVDQAREATGSLNGYAFLYQFLHEMLQAGGCSHAELDKEGHGDMFQDGTWQPDPVVALQETSDPSAAWKAAWGRSFGDAKKDQNIVPTDGAVCDEFLEEFVRDSLQGLCEHLQGGSTPKEMGKIQKLCGVGSLYVPRAPPPGEEKGAGGTAWVNLYDGTKLPPVPTTPSEFRLMAARFPRPLTTPTVDPCNKEAAEQEGGDMAAEPQDDDVSQAHPTATGASGNESRQQHTEVSGELPASGEKIQTEVPRQGEQQAGGREGSAGSKSEGKKGETMGDGELLTQVKPLVAKAKHNTAEVKKKVMEAKAAAAAETETEAAVETEEANTKAMAEAEEAEAKADAEAERVAEAGCEGGTEKKRRKKTSKSKSKSKSKSTSKSKEMRQTVEEDGRAVVVPEDGAQEDQWLPPPPSATGKLSTTPEDSARVTRSSGHAVPTGRGKSLSNMVGSLPEETEKRTVESSGLEADPTGTAVGGAKSELPLRPPGRKRRQGAVQPQDPDAMVVDTAVAEPVAGNALESTQSKQEDVSMTLSDSEDADSSSRGPPPAKRRRVRGGRV